jgi:eukaryotic-like serine/threonine-protein kinase
VIVDGRYRLGPRLGRGGMADVFEAWDERLERKVAIKRYRDAPIGVGLRRFMSEAELLGRLSHPGLLTVFDVSFDGERPFLVLRLATGGSLADRLATGSLLATRVAEIGAAVAEVLTYIHARGIVHRDVKPSNLLFDDEGECYLADFGIATTVGAEHITEANEFVGTAAYLAPEQVEDPSPGAAADVYALGLVLLECMTGHPEYSGNDVEMAVARLHRPPRIPSTLGSEWQAVLSAMTATDAADRPDAEQCVSLLRALEAGRTVEMARPVRRSRRIYAGMVTLAAAAVAALAFTSGPVPVDGNPAADPTQVARNAPAQSGTAPAAVAPTTQPQPQPQADAVNQGGGPAAGPPAGGHHGKGSGKEPKSGGKGKG